MKALVKTVKTGKKGFSIIKIENRFTILLSGSKKMLSGVELIKLALKGDDRMDSDFRFHTTKFSYFANLKDAKYDAIDRLNSVYRSTFNDAQKIALRREIYNVDMIEGFEVVEFDVWDIANVR